MDRIWKCPLCGATQKTGGEVTCCRCSCREEATWMNLVQDSSSTRHFAELKQRVRPKLRPTGKFSEEPTPKSEAKPEVIVPTETELITDPDAAS